MPSSYKGMQRLGGCPVFFRMSDTSLESVNQCLQVTEIIRVAHCCMSLSWSARRQDFKRRISKNSAIPARKPMPCLEGAGIYFRALLAAPTPSAAKTIKITARIRNRPNRILAIPEKPAAMPPNPKAPIISEIIAKIMAYLSTRLSSATGDAMYRPTQQCIKVKIT